MSTIKTNTFTGTTSAGSINVTGEGGSTTTNLQQGLCKVWARTNMSTAANSDSFNVSSITDNGTGNFTITINNDMGNANYTVTDSADNISSNTNVANQVEQHATGSYLILHNEDGSLTDTTTFGHSAHGDLA